MANEILQIAGNAWEFQNPNIRNFRPEDTQAVEDLSKRLGQNYDGHTPGWITERYGKSQQENPYGFFTKQSGLVVAGNIGEPNAMLSWAFKRGGSLKLNTFASTNPITGVRFLNEMIDMAQANNQVRKLYATVSNENAAVLRLCLGLGFKTEAVLPHQYKEGSNEIVIGMMLNPEPQKVAVKMLHGENITAQTRIFNPERDNENLARLFEYLSGWHDDVGLDFLKQTVRGAEFGVVDIMRKGKTILVAERSRKELNGVLVVDPKYDLSGSVVLTGKMGGPIKMYPLLGDTASQQELIMSARQVAQENRFRVAYTFSPSSDSKEAEFLESIGFKARGVLREPYKPGVDLIPWSAGIEELTS